MPITQLDRDLLEDLQLRDDDRTDDLVGAHEDAPAPVAAGNEGDVPHSTL
ncbi:hypothetical protein SAMN05445060_3920 [Williamsia sterculiae]|uniref:Uncharacterized protein n=1 Tax=Williamsia sterculiae TaxID=1344003 RepID=A0A1N7HBC9_9NOCA|nr:hypothetical protein SAMN05445060_3920 [Williamsia sterculiae]